jgi:hypothetical protein
MHQATQLIAIIHELAELHRRLAGAVEAQRDSMRRADPAALDDAGRRIQRLVGAIADRELARRQRVEELAAGLKVSGAELPTLSQLAAALDARRGERLRQASDRLRHEMERVSRAERVNRSVAAKMSAFFGDLFGQIAQAARDTGCYNQRGQRAMASPSATPSSFSAVG